MAKIHGLAITITALLALIPAARAQDNDALYASARRGGALVLYTGGPAAPWERTAEQFQLLYPAIKVSVTGGFSNVLDQQVDDQLGAKKLEVDAVIFQTLADFVRWKAQQVLLAFKPQGWDRIDDSFKDVDGAFVGIAVNAHPYEYNTRLVAAADVPRSASDFLKPMFRGRIVTCYPADDDATLYVMYSIVQKYGWGYMDRYMANQPVFIQGHLGAQHSIAAGANLVTFDSVMDMTLRQIEAGDPVGWAISSTDPLPIWPLTAAIFKDAPHADAAKLFLNWFLAPEQQRRMHSWSVRSDVPPPPGLRPILSYNVVNNYRAFLSDTALIATLRQRFAAYSGPIVNTGGVR